MENPYSAYSANYTTPAPSTPAASIPCPNCQPQTNGFVSLPQLSGAFQNPFPVVGAEQLQINQAPMVTGSGAPSTSSGLQIPNDQQMLQPITDLNQPYPITAESLQYLNGFMRTQIGRKVRVEFLIGTNTTTDRIGILIGVGANYILLNEIETDDILACDFYNIKFIRFYY